MILRPPQSRVTLLGRSLRVAALLLAGVVAAGTPTAQGAGTPRAVEYGIKAAYLFNFTKFIDWPATAFADESSPFLIGVLDREGVAAGAVKDAFTNKTTHTGRLILVRVFPELDPGLVGCHLVFVAQSAGGELDAVSRMLGSRPILLTGESEQFAQRGGTINLVTVSDAVRCEINLSRAQRAGLRLSGRLASIARLVRDTEFD